MKYFEFVDVDGVGAGEDEGGTSIFDSGEDWDWTVIVSTGEGLLSFLSFKAARASY